MSRYGLSLAKPTSPIDSRKYILDLTVSSSSNSNVPPKLPGFLKFIAACSNLVKLELKLPLINDDDLWVLTTHCPNLQGLSIVSSLQHPPGKITDQGLAAICAKWEHLKQLAIRVSWQGAGGRWMDGISERYVHISMFRQTYCTLTFQCLRTIFRGLQTIADTYAGKLESFGFGMIDLPAEMVNNDPSWRQNIQNLEHAIVDVISKNPKLKSIRVEWPLDLDNLLQAIMNHCKQLESLDFGSTHKSKYLPVLVSNCKKLKSLKLSDMQLTEQDAKTIYQSLTGTDHLFDVVDGKSVFYSKYLKELELDGLGYLPNLLPTPGSFPFLRKLKILPSRSTASVHSTSSDLFLVQIFKTMPFLESVTVPILCDDPLKVLALNCPNLQELDVVDGKEITDEGVTLLAKGCPRLSRLALGSSPQITDHGISILAKSLGHRISRLSLPFGNTHFGSQMLQNLQTFCPRLEALVNIPLCNASFTDLLTFVTQMQRLHILGLSDGESNGAAPFVKPRYLDRFQVDQLKKASKRLKQVIQIS